MIEYFRHEAMNQATVVFGFTEIINNLLQKTPEHASPEITSVLERIQRIIIIFNETLSVFREECSLEGVTREQLLAFDPYGDITQYLSEGCRVQYLTLRDVAETLYGVTGSLDLSKVADEKIADRFTLIHESAAKLVDLFLHPLLFLQRVVREHTA